MLFTGKRNFKAAEPLRFFAAIRRRATGKINFPLVTRENTNTKQKADICINTPFLETEGRTGTANMPSIGHLSYHPASRRPAFSNTFIDARVKRYRRCLKRLIKL